MPITALLMSGSALGATLTVGGSGADHTAIQEAIDAASSGDRIEVSAGLYSENLDFDGKDLEVVGVDGAAGTILTAADGDEPVVSFTGGETSAALLEELTLRNVGGQGVWIEGASPTLRGLLLSDHDAESGASVYIDSGDPVIEDCTFSSGDSTYGGFVYVGGASSAPVIRDSTFSDGGASFGGAIFVDYGASLTVEDCTFEEVSAAVYGGAFYVNANASLEAIDVDLQFAGASTAGAVLVGGVGSSASFEDTSLVAWTDTAQLYLLDGSLRVDGLSASAWSSSQEPLLVDADGTSDVTLTGIDWPDMGGIAEVEEGTLSLSDCTVTSANGRAVLAQGSDVIIDGCDISETHSSSYTVYVTDGDLTVSDSSFDSNRSGVFYLDSVEAEISSSSFTDNTDSSGAVVYFSSSSGSTLSVSESSFEGNEATAGAGGVALLGAIDAASFEGCTFIENTAAEEGGAIAAPGAPSLTLSDSTFEDNSSGADGGAVSADGELTVDGCTFTDNTAAVYGGALDASIGGPLDLHASWFTGNSALRGGALYVRDVPATIDECEFERNQSTAWGGAVYVVSTEDWTLQRSRFCDNVGSVGAAVASQSTGTLEILGNILVGNEASNGGGALYLSTTSGVLGSVDHNTFADNRSVTTAGGGALSLYGQPVDFTNNIVFDSEGDGVSVTSAGNLLAYNDWFDNVTVHVSGELSDDDIAGLGNLQVDPGFTSWDGSCGSDLTLATGSSLVDAGTGSDPDGSTADMGAYGGSAPYAWDRDGDGFDDRSDCDDTDASVYPGATEIDGDGIDQDCDGVDPEGSGDDGGDNGSSDDGGDEGSGDEGSGDEGSGDDGDDGSSDDTGLPQDDTGVDGGTAGGDDTYDDDDEDDSEGCSGCAAPVAPMPALPILLLGLILTRRRGRRAP